MHTSPRLDIPRRKLIASKILDFPLPFAPVMAVNVLSNPDITVLSAYDLKPCKMICLIYI